MVVSIVISFVFFYLCNMSLNIISLAGLILALGMMIDSSIIVTENISQYRERGYSLRRACVTGTSEVVTPMLSSSLTTIAVFAPLIFMSGIAGAIFFDQAFRHCRTDGVLSHRYHAASRALSAGLPDRCPHPEMEVAFFQI